MGVIQRQGIKYSIVNFTGLAIGMASTVFVYSRAEVVEAYGLVQFLLSIGIIGFPLFALASNSVAIRFFPNFQDKAKAHNGFLPLLLYMTLAGWGICALTVLLAHEPIERLIGQNSGTTKQYLWVAFPLTLFFTMGMVLVQYASNFKRIVVPSILFDFSLKILMPAMMVAIWLKWIDLEIALYWLLIHYLLVVIGMAVYLRSLGEWTLRPNWAFLTPELLREIARYAGFGVVTGISVLLVSKADTLLVGPMTTMQKNGFYAIALNIATAIDIPTRGLLGTSASFVARYLADENWTEMRSLYRKVSINLLAAGLLIFGCIWISADDLYAMMANGEEAAQGKSVLLILGAAKLFDMASGMNNQLVYYSRYYRFSMISLVLLAAANICFNIWLIPRLGLAGAAVSTLLSMFLYNLSGLFVVWRKFHMQPFSGNTLRIIGLAAIALAAIWFLPSTPFPLLNITLRSGLFSLIFTVLVLRFRVSADINQLWQDLLTRLRKTTTASDT